MVIYHRTNEKLSSRLIFDLSSYVLHVRCMCVFTLKERKKTTELRKLLRLDPVSLVIKKGRLRWSGHVEGKGDTVWIKCCTTVIGIDGIRRLRKTC